MNYKIEFVDSFKVAGVREKIEHGNEFSILWDKFFDTVPESEFKSLGFSKGYGVIINMDEETTDYFVGYEFENEDKVRELGLEILEIDAGSYLKLVTVGAIPDSIKSGWDYIWKTIFESGKYAPTGGPSLEVYFEGDLYAKNYKMEIWVPVVEI